MIDGEDDDLAQILQPVVDVLINLDALSSEEIAANVVAALEGEKMLVFAMEWQRRAVTNVVRRTLDSALEGVKGHADHDS